jgi:hypothetical protein
VQYAVLNLAGLHLSLGHQDMTLATVGEAVRVAQQNGDHVCVAFALAWLQRLLVSTGVGACEVKAIDTSRDASPSCCPTLQNKQDQQAEEVLLRCTARASEQRLRHLEVTCELSLAASEATGSRLQHPQHAARALALAGSSGAPPPPVNPAAQAARMPGGAAAAAAAAAPQTGRAEGVSAELARLQVRQGRLTAVARA